MTNDAGGNDAEPATGAKRARHDERVAAEMRANLKKRKAKARARERAATDDGGESR